MPHIIIKIHAGRSEAQKAGMAEAVALALRQVTGHGDGSVTVSIEDVAPADWVASVYKPEIIGKPDTLYKKPGYTPAL